MGFRRRQHFRGPRAAELQPVPSRAHHSGASVGPRAPGKQGKGGPCVQRRSLGLGGLRCSPPVLHPGCLRVGETEANSQAPPPAHRPQPHLLGHSPERDPGTLGICALPQHLSEDHLDQWVTRVPGWAPGHGHLILGLPWALLAWPYTVSSVSDCECEPRSP